MTFHEPSPIPRVSVVAPVFNEADVIADFVAQLSDALSEWPGGFELVCVDDGSIDDTTRVLASLRAAHPQLRVLRLARNYGQQMALMAGMDFARGANVVLIDADLQRSPYSIPQLLHALDERTDVVFGIRPDRKDSASRRIASRVVAVLLTHLTGNTIPDCTTAFVAMQREFVERLRLHRSRNRVLSYLLLSLSRGRCKTVEVEHHPRQGGRSKQRLRPLISLVLSLCMEAGFGVPDILWALAAFHGVAATVGAVSYVVLGCGHALGTVPMASLAVAAVGYTTAMVCAGLALLSHQVTRLWREAQAVPPYVAWEETERHGL